MRSAAALLGPVSAAVLLFLPYVLSNERFFCGPTTMFPPWTPPAAPSARTYDLDVTDQAVFMWPNYDHWKKSVRGDRDGVFWNPDHLCGTPFLATQDTNALYPANWLAFLGDGTDVFAWTAFLHVLIAGLGTYALLRRTGATPAAAGIGATAFAAGSWMVAHLDYPNFPQTAAWTPWILFAADRATLLRRHRDRVLLASMVAISCYAGMIQLTVVSLLTAGLWSLVRAIGILRKEDAGRACRGLVSALIGVICGLLLAAPQLLPLFDYASSGDRMQASREDIRPWCLPATEWVTLLAPDLLPSAPALLEARRSGLPHDVVGPHEFPPTKAIGLRGAGVSFSESVFTPYATGMVLVLAAFAARNRRLFVGLALTALGAAAAADTPVFDLIHAAPGTAFGNPRRWLLVAATGFAVLIATGVEAVLAGRGRRSAAIFPLTTFAAALVVLFGQESLARLVAERSLAGTEAVTASLVVLRSTLLRATAFGAAAVLALYAPVRFRTPLLAALLIGEAVLFQTTHNPGQDRTELFPATATSEMLREGSVKGAPTSRRVAKLLGDEATCRAILGTPPTPHLLAANLPSLYDVRDVHGYEGVLNPRVAEVFERLEPGSVLFDHRLETFRLPETLARPLIDFLGVRHVLSQRATATTGLRLERTLPEERLVVLANDDARPTETCVSRARVFDSPEALLTALVGPEFAPEREVLLMRSDAAALGLPAPGPDGLIVLPEPETAATVRIDVRGSAGLAGRIESRAPRLLVVAEAYDPGFRYAADGGSALKTVRANHAFQATFVPGGGGFVRTYRPRTWNLALGCAGFGILALAVDSRFRRRAAAAAPDRAVTTS